MSDATTAASVDEGDEEMASTAQRRCCRWRASRMGCGPWAGTLVDRARTEGVALTWEDGLFDRLAGLLPQRSSRTR